MVFRKKSLFIAKIKKAPAGSQVARLFIGRLTIGGAKVLEAVRGGQKLRRPDLCPSASASRRNRLALVSSRKPRPFKDEQQSMTDGIPSTRIKSGIAGAIHCWFYTHGY
jgi:hypothetical protein